MSSKVARDTSHTLPCLNTKQLAVKIISKDQQPLDKLILIFNNLSSVQQAVSNRAIEINESLNILFIHMSIHLASILIVLVTVIYLLTIL